MMKDIPRELILHSFKDFCIRYEEIYDCFWNDYEPYYDIAIYRDYILENVHLANSESRQEFLAGLIWEYLMGDIDISYLFYIYHTCKIKD